MSIEVTGLELIKDVDRYLLVYIIFVFLFLGRIQKGTSSARRQPPTMSVEPKQLEPPLKIQLVCNGTMRGRGSPPPPPKKKKVKKHCSCFQSKTGANSMQFLCRIWRGSLLCSLNFCTITRLKTIYIFLNIGYRIKVHVASKLIDLV